ncbi:ABC transporter ATP-binding protein [Corynebacterium sp. zg-331]|uniref:ATP-binding cassette domain-containing protein n=1 Tax=unclassified Corynebacterium TaxID=2624378 RepID=UPI00128D6B7B|nr:MULTISPECIES: ABC transporter ATP-binding protein [unclassified Corynebacterium]MBC3185097.1 ABC transporter ATP-binding protein [Corynebacterium sp. zg-331]MPV51595.1 ATP-binding cassette domain-containing protein [Corynebacterium sp. zg331]
MTLRVTDLGVTTHDGTDVVAGLSFELSPGQSVGLIGESGSGKTLTALALMGLCPLPVRGGIALGEKQLVGLPERGLRRVRGRRIAMIFQEPMTALDPLMAVGRQLTRAMPGLSRHQTARRAEALWADVGLEPEHFRAYPHQLSGGQRQRVLIAMALAQDPEVLICDEPTTALDATVQRRIMALIRRLTERRGIAVLFISHDLSLVAGLCDWLLVMEAGRIIERGTTSHVLAHPDHPRTRALVAATSLTPRAQDAGGTVCATEETGVPAIEVAGLCRTFRSSGRTTPALRGIDLEVPRGTRLGIVGGSGSGKTTLLKMIAGLETPDAGTVQVHGRPQMVFQDPFSSFNPRMRIGAAITEPLGRLPRARRRERVRELMEQVGIDPAAARRFPHEFSGGQRQRLSVARALSTDPEIVLADEAVSALDVTVRAAILDLLDRAMTPRRTLVFVSHDLGVIRHLCTHVVVMRRGEIVERGPVERVWNHPAHPYTRELLAAATPPVV